MQAVTTKYLGPTNTRGSRVKATCQAGSVTIGWDDALNSDQNHNAAALTLIEKWGWCGKWLEGQLTDGSHVYVCVTRFFEGIQIVETGP